MRASRFCPFLFRADFGVCTFVTGHNNIGGVAGQKSKLMAAALGEFELAVEDELAEGRHGKQHKGSCLSVPGTLCLPDLYLLN